MAVDTWSADWDQADVTDVKIAGNDTKKYTNLVFAGIEFTSQPIDADAMTHFHMDIWTPDPTTAPGDLQGQAGGLRRQRRLRRRRRRRARDRR